MEKIIEIPDGYEARIDGNKVVIEPKPSEDERMRKILIKWCQEHEKEEWFEYEVATYGDVLAWLEKKREQKPNISGEAIRDGIIHFGITQYQIDNWLKKHINVIEQKPAEWSKEDEKCCKIALLALNDHPLNQDELKAFNWLRALKSRFGWKPTKELMESLEGTIQDLQNRGWLTPGLDELYDELKKLK